MRTRAVPGDGILLPAAGLPVWTWRCVLRGESVNLNMHDIVRGAITSINEDRPGTVYVSTGYTNVRGILTPTFAPVTATLQVQAQKHDPLRHDRALQYSNAYLTIYAYGNFSDLERPDGKGGDVVQMTDDSKWYAITQVLEWWPTWSCFEVTRQLNAANVQALIAAIKNGANP
jgi:hypothetical protein